MQYIMIEEVLTPIRTYLVGETVSPNSFLSAATLKFWEQQGKCKEVINLDISGKVEQENNNTTVKLGKTARRK